MSRTGKEAKRTPRSAAQESLLMDCASLPPHGCLKIFGRRPCPAPAAADAIRELFLHPVPLHT